MTKYLETKTNSIEETISSVVIGEKFTKKNFAKNETENQHTRNGVELVKMFGTPEEKRIMTKIAKNHKERGSIIPNEQFLRDRLVKKYYPKLKEEVTLDEAKYEVQYTVSSRVGDSRSRTKSRLSKIDIDAKSKDDAEKKFFKQAEKSPMMKDAMRRDMLDVVYVGLKESLDEGYESEVLKVLKDADIEGYFKMGKLYVSRRDAKDAKKALEDSDDITKLPKMVMEDERMKKLTKRQRQALSSPAAKGKGKGGITLPGAEFLSKKKKPMKVGRQSQVVKYEENEMDIVDTVRGIVEKKLDPVNPKAVKKKFDDRKDKDIDNDGDVDSTDKYLHKRRKAISKAVKNERVTDVAVDQAKRDLKHAKLKKATADVKNEVYDIGKDYAEHTLEVTPGQDKKDVDKMLNTAYTKNQSMREALAKVWGLGEGKSPFQKEEEKPLTKTMTGQKPTSVKVNPKIEEK